MTRVICFRTKALVPESSSVRLPRALREPAPTELRTGDLPDSSIFNDNRSRFTAATVETAPCAKTHCDRCGDAAAHSVFIKGLTWMDGLWLCPDCLWMAA